MDRVLKVEFVDGGSQAESLGIRAGDILVSYDGTPLSSSLGLENAVYLAKEAEKDKVGIVVLRNGTEMVLEGTPGRLLGLNVEEAVAHTQIAESASSNGPMPSDYGVAKAVAGFVAFVGWALVAIGVIAVFVALQQATQSNRIMPGAAVMVALMPGFISAGLGFLLVMGAQVTRAVVDTADYAREILKAVERRGVG